jgi:hypothetical protein
VDDKAFWGLIRRALLLFVDAIEQRWGFERTSALRKESRE